MRIVQILPELKEGGVERGAIDLSKCLDNDNIENYIISNGGILSKDIKNHIKFDVSSKSVISFLPRVFKLKKLLRTLNPDIVHVRSRIPAWLVYFAKNGLNFKVVSTVHGLNSVNFYSKIMVMADAIICVSNCVKEYILKNFKADIKKTEVIFRGVDLSSFNPNKCISKQALRSKYNLELNSFLISVVGRITNLKNLETIIKAINILKEQKFDVKLLVAGGVHEKRKKYYDNLIILIKELNLQNEVKFLGSIKEINEIYALSDVLVSASIKPESFGRSVAEAIAMNCPVVASNHGGVKDIILDGANGYFFEPLNDIELSQKIILAKDLNFDGFSYIKSKFSLQKMYNETLQIYKKVLHE